MFITHTNSIYSEEITFIKDIPYPQYVHQVSDGGMAVARGIKILPAELINYVLKGKFNANTGTSKFITELSTTHAGRIGFIVAAGGTIWTGYGTTIKETSRYPKHKLPILGMSNTCAGQIAGQLGKFEYIATDCTSCISGHSAWYTAQNLLLLDKLDAVVVVAVDNGTSEENMYIFGEHKLVKLVKEETQPGVVKFRLGQGCNITVLESPAFTKKTGNTPIAIVSDMCITAELHNNAVGISPSGEGYAKVISRVDTTGIDFVKTHSTFSVDNNIEDQIIEKLLGDVRSINYKLRIGHTMGASTAIETALAICEESGKFISLGAGMGNVFSSAVVEIL